MKEIFIENNPTVYSQNVDSEIKVSFYRNTKLLIHTEGEVEISFRDKDNYAPYPAGKLIPVLSPTGLECVYIKGSGNITLWGYR